MACGPDPAGHGLVVNAEDVGDGGARFAAGHGLHRLLPAAFQLASNGLNTAVVGRTEEHAHMFLSQACRRYVRLKLVQWSQD